MSVSPGYKPGLFLTKLCSMLSRLIAASKLKLALMDAVKPDEQTPIRELIPFGQMSDFFGSAAHHILRK